MRSVFDLEPAPLDAHAEWSEFEEDAEADRSSPRYVRWVQQALNQLLGLRLAVDGIMGAMTRSAVRSAPSALVAESVGALRFLTASTKTRS